MNKIPDNFPQPTEDSLPGVRRWARHLLSNDLIFDVGALLYTAMTSNSVWLANSARLIDTIQSPGPRFTVLDLGAGPGTSALAMGERQPEAHFIAFDLAGQMLALARRNRQAAGWSPARLMLAQGDALHLPLASATVDVVTAHSFLYLVADASAVLRESYRVLRPGGCVAFLEPHAGNPDWQWLWRQPPPGLQISLTLWRFYSWVHRRFSAMELAGALRAAGFINVTTEVTLGGFGLFGRGEKP
jgi:ubiquinone/menaquinone biosynthesis C-methylase UbiE